MATIKTRKAYKAKGSRALATDLGVIASQVVVATLLGGMAGGLAAHTWRGAFIGSLSIASVALFLARRVTNEGRYIGWGVGTAAGVSALALSFGPRPSSPAAPPSTAGLGRLGYATSCRCVGGGCSCTTPKLSGVGCGCSSAMQLGAAKIHGLAAAKIYGLAAAPVYGHPLGAH